MAFSNVQRDQIEIPPDHLFPFFFPPFSFSCALSSSVFTNPPLTKASLATLLIMRNLSGPSFVPPYQRVTTTTTFQTSISCMRCNRRPPAAVSPSSSQSCTVIPVSVVWIRHAVILCVALATFLFVARRCEREDDASSLLDTGVHRATKMLFFSVTGSERVQLGGGMEGSAAVVTLLSSVSSVSMGSADFSSSCGRWVVSASPWRSNSEPASSITSNKQTWPGDQTR